MFGQVINWAQERKVSQCGCVLWNSTFVQFKSPLHHYRLNCIQSPKCASVNYNECNGTCIELPVPCVLGDNNPTKMYMMYNNKVHNDCFHETALAELTANHIRQVYNTSNNRKVTRILYQTGAYPACARVNSAKCFSGTGTLWIKNNKDDICEILVLSPSCTAAWVLCKAGQPLTACTETEGPIADWMPHSLSCLQQRDSLTRIAFVIVPWLVDTERWFMILLIITSQWGC